MSHTAFQNEVYRFLSDYKHSAFPDAQDGTWRNVSYGHVFIKEDAFNNILIPKSSGISLIRKQNSYKIVIDNHHQFSLHADWSHLNSSQILCINYFYDFLSNPDKLSTFVNLLGITMKPICGEFEVNPGDGSSIDFVVHFENGKSLFCEIKYSESNFGKADTKKYGEDFYRNRKKKYYSNVKITDIDYFKYYQIVRNICLATSGNHTLFLYPSRNKSVANDLTKGLESISKIEDFAYHQFTWEALLQKIPNSKVQEKYFPYTND